jgi:hypothetical protein
MCVKELCNGKVLCALVYVFFCAMLRVCVCVRHSVPTSHAAGTLSSCRPTGSMCCSCRDAHIYAYHSYAFAAGT